jgi:hypothetical protein
MSQDIKITKKIIEISDIQYPIVKGDFVDQWKFTIPKVYDGIDLSSGFTWYCKFIIETGAGDLSELTATVDVDDLTLLWIIPDTALSRKGPLRIQIIGVSDTYIWQSLFAQIEIKEQLSPSGQEFTVTYLETYLQIFNGKILEAGEYAQSVVDSIFEVVQISGEDYLKYNY